MIDQLPSSKDLLTASPFKEIPIVESLTPKCLQHAIAVGGEAISKIWSEEGARPVELRSIDLKALHEAWKEQINVPVVWLKDKCSLMRTALGEGIKQSEGSLEMKISLEAVVAPNRLVYCKLVKNFPGNVAGRGITRGDYEFVFRSGVPILLADVMGSSSQRVWENDDLTLADVGLIQKIPYYDRHEFIALKLANANASGETIVIEKMM